MKSFLAKKAGFCVLLFSLSPMVHADLFGVEDLALLLKAGEQLKELESQTTTLTNQLNSINELKDLNKGAYGHGAFQNDLDALNGWKNPADNWKDALENISGGNKDRYLELVKSYEESHPMVSDEIYSKGATQGHLEQYKYNKKINKAISVETTKTFNEINDRLKSVSALAARIDQTANTKSAVDLNSRITAELAYISLMNLKLQTLVSQQIAQNAANDLAAEGEMAQFNSVGNK